MQGLWEREGGGGASTGIRDRQREPRGGRCGGLEDGGGVDYDPEVTLIRGGKHTCTTQQQGHTVRRMDPDLQLSSSWAREFTSLCVCFLSVRRKR